MCNQRCDYLLCKKCCRSKGYNEELDCSGHRILVKTKRELARARVAREAEEEAAQKAAQKAVGDTDSDKAAQQVPSASPVEV